MKKTALMDLQTMNYLEAWAIQEQLMEKLKEEKRSGIEGTNYLLLVEHPHVYTIGRNGNRNNLLVDPILLKSKNAGFVEVDRGGDVTYHGYGQLVAYPIVRLDKFGLGIKEYVYRLEEIAIRTIAGYGLKSSRLAGSTGVWIDADKNTARKICAIGVRCSESVSMHGFALNVNTDLEYFSSINPCGITDKGVTSIEKELNQKVNFEDIKKAVIKNFITVLGMEIPAENGGFPL